jgi:hypothetical protein
MSREFSGAHVLKVDGKVVAQITDLSIEIQHAAQIRTPPNVAEVALPDSWPRPLRSHLQDFAVTGDLTTFIAGKPPRE